MLSKAPKIPCWRGGLDSGVASGLTRRADLARTGRQPDAMQRVERDSNTHQRGEQEPRLSGPNQGRCAQEGAQEQPEHEKPTGGFVPFCIRLKPSQGEEGDRSAGDQPDHGKASRGQVLMVHVLASTILL